LVDALERMLFDHEILEDIQYFASIAENSAAGEGAPLVVWSPELEIGVTWIDSHHRSLVATLNEIGRLGPSHEEGEAGSLLDRLRRHAWHHFHDEEARLPANDSSREHVQQHRRLLAELDELIVKVREKNVDLAALARDYLRYWLIDHIKGTDCRDFTPQA
jgi:hemerythrin